MKYFILLVEIIHIFKKKEIVKLIATSRIYGCTGCIFSNNSGYPNLGYELGRRCPGIDQIGWCINMRYKQYSNEFF